MSYISLSDKDKKEMLSKIGAASCEELFDSIPAPLKLHRKLKVPGPLAENEILKYFQTLGQKNSFSEHLSFLGAGIYSHLIPSVVDYLSQRGEFISPYTPYQPEVSQGTLQIIFEFQTLICQLTGLDIANASLYDGASGAAEAVLMAHRIRGKRKVFVARSVHPQYKKTIETYVRNLPVDIEEVGFDASGRLDLEELHNRIDEETNAVVIQSPNFFGAIEEVSKVADAAHSKNALFIVVIAEAFAMGILEAPGKLGADIVTGEAQSFGLPLSFGGPTLGFMSCRQEFIRQFPGRIAGETKDVEGRRGFVLTLSTREQHIRRERATSNICTNQAWCALRATIYLSSVGQEGLRELARRNLLLARYTQKVLESIDGVSIKFEGNFFNEFVCSFSKPWDEIDAVLRDNGIVGGFPLGDDYPELSDCVLFCVTETNTKEDISRLSEVLKKALQDQTSPSHL